MVWIDPDMGDFGQIIRSLERDHSHDVRVEFGDAPTSAVRNVAVSLDGTAWQDVWTSQAETVCDVEIDEALQTKQGPAKYVYFVKVAPGVEAIESLRIESDLMTSPHGLPRLGGESGDQPLDD